MKKFILLFPLILVVFLSGCVQQPVCGNDICEKNSGETDDTCPQDCPLEAENCEEEGGVYCDYKCSGKFVGVLEISGPVDNCCFGDCIKDCPDGTPSGECSEEIPKFCREGELLEICDICGCSEEEACIEGKCKQVECLEGQIAECGTDAGECRDGLKYCVDNKWGDCLNSTGPSKEACDLKDNDCDGQTDEGCECTIGEVKECGTDLGECEKGIQSCEYGVWSNCIGEIKPETETCNGLDDDCDGVADENCPQIKTCSEQDGYVCSAEEDCPRNWLNVSDTNRCCDDECLTPAIGLKILDPGNGIYLGAYNFDNGIEAFENAIGKKVAIGCKNVITDGGTEGTMPGFDRTGHEECYQDGYISVYSIEYLIPSSTHSPHAIINGVLDNEIMQVAMEIESFNRPIFWFYQKEPRLQPTRTMNEEGDPYIPSGYDGGGYGPNGDETYDDVISRGGDPDNEYGDPSKLDGPERYVDSVKHIHDLVESIAPNKVTWVMGAMTTGDMDDVIKTNAPGHYTSYIDYYPGDDYVDWHALDLHAWPENGIRESFSTEIEPAYSDAMEINQNKPLMIGEFSAVKGEDDRSAWFNDFFQKVKTNYSQVATILYWQQVWGRVDPTDPSAQAWQQEMQAYPNFWLSEVKTG